MSDTPTSDIFASGLSSWSAAVRAGRLSFRQTIEICLDRAAAESSLNAFECIDTDRARATGDAMDTLLCNGTDLGSLMGLPIAVKDIMSVDGLPTSNGSNADTAHLTGSQGSVVSCLRKAGAIVLGKTRTVEFALGATGVNEARGTPWNPADRDVHRIPGGSSSGSAVATATGMVGMGLGTDTGGSVRIPACFTGLVGHKTSVGLWPTDGIFSLSSTLDSVGPLCRTVKDTAMLHTFMTGEAVVARPSVAGLRFGVPHSVFLEDLDTAVEHDFFAACDKLETAGAIRVAMDFPEAAERSSLFPAIVPAELLTTLTPELFAQVRDQMDSVTAERAAVGLTVTATQYLAAQRRKEELVQLARKTFNAVDCWVSPTCPFLPMPVADLANPVIAKRALLASRNTQPGNLLDFCGISLPMHGDGLPTGFQIMMPWGHDAKLLAAASAAEVLLRSESFN